MGSFQDFSSWPREQEQSFVVFEQRAQESQTKAWMTALIAGAVFFVFALGVFFGVAPQHQDLTKGMNMDNLSKKKKDSAVAPTPDKPAEKPADPPKAEAPAKTDTPAEKPADPPK